MYHTRFFSSSQPDLGEIILLVGWEIFDIMYILVIGGNRGNQLVNTPPISHIDGD
jgi:hypothetical protein